MRIRLLTPSPPLASVLKLTLQKQHDPVPGLELKFSQGLCRQESRASSCGSNAFSRVERALAKPLAAINP